MKKMGWQNNAEMMFYAIRKGLVKEEFPEKEAMPLLKSNAIAPRLLGGREALPPHCPRPLAG